MQYKTPLLKQYFEIVAQYPETIVLMRVGDFYETYGTIAVEASKILGITLTRRAIGSSIDSYNLELSGFPYHSLDTYLSKLVQTGHKIVLCDQIEDPAKAKGLVKRAVTEVITPGLVTQECVLSNKTNNYLCSIYCYKTMFGVSFLDISTGEFCTSECDILNLQKLIDSFNPNEIIYSKEQEGYILNLIDEKKLNIDKKKIKNGLQDWIYKKSNAIDILTRHFGVLNIKGLGLEDRILSLISSGAVLQYLKDTGHNNIEHITTLFKIEHDKYMYLDKFTIKNLELVKSQYDTGSSLLDVLDHTKTPMGGRKLKKWITLPLIDIDLIKKRLEYVTIFYENENNTKTISDELLKIMDFERIFVKISMKKSVPNDFLTLKTSLKSVAIISSITEKLGLDILFYKCSDLIDKIEKTIADNPTQSNYIKPGVNQNLDEYKKIKSHGNENLNELLNREIKNTGINSLKIGYNKIFGYYFDVSNSNLDKVPQTWIRKQTLTTGERFINDELKIFEEKILNADIKISEIETEIFNELVNYALKFNKEILSNANSISTIDCYINFAILAKKNKYVCPIVNNSDKIKIKSGRHPVIEPLLVLPDFFVPNDIELDNENQQIMLITGPNMAGKSSVLREVALIVIMAQIGSYVPANSAEIGIVDRIFTRVGASDNVSSGESTFMLEMTETANILHNLTRKSLVLMDEIGRGTSTYDGISIAQAIIEYLHNSKFSPKTMFSTHYHELCDLEDKLPRLKNFRLSIIEKDGKIIFVRRLEKARSTHSFGINVAKLAGVPNEIILRANEILSKLEKENLNLNINTDIKLNHYNDLDNKNNSQLEIKKIINLINSIEINNITPLEALYKLNELKNFIKNIND